jgi:GNAT superfamily N-acetyltransferase
VPPALTFRRATPVEAGDLRALSLRAKQSHGYDESFMQLLVGDFEAVITPEIIARDTFQIAERDGRVLGFAHLMPVDQPDTVYLEDLYVEPNAHGTGVGRALFEWAAAEARRRGYAWLEWDSDPNAAPFYARMGGEQIGETKSTLVEGRVIPKFRMALS